MESMMIFVLLVVGLISCWYFVYPRLTNQPPHVPHFIPFIANAIQFGIDPVKFILDCKAKYGDCFTFTMLGRQMTFCLGPDGNNFVFNVKLKQATAEGAYLKLTRPVFGSDVVYDVDNSLFMEQKKFVKDALSTAAFRTYVPIIVDETMKMIKEEWSGSKSINLFENMAELTIRTASSCLMGKEIRDQLYSDVTKLYYDLDRGLTPLNVFVEYLPLPRFIRRDRANKRLTDLFIRIMKERRSGEQERQRYDILDTLIHSVYRNGEPMPDHAVAHLMIALLLAGQHTSSTTSTWMLFRLAQHPDLIDKLLKEQSQVLTGKPDTAPKDLPDFTLETLKECTLLDLIMKETLRLHPPIHTVMRLVEEDLEYKGMTIPKGHFLCAAITAGHLDPVKYPDPHKFDPYRHQLSEEGGEWTFGGVDIAQKSARNHYLPFGAGRHRCIGEHFAFIQNKTIVGTILRHYEIHLGEEGFPPSDFTQLIVLPVKGAQLYLRERQ